MSREETLESILLIGNSRYHWAYKVGNKWEFKDEDRFNTKDKHLEKNLKAWAAVGERPKHKILNPTSRIKTKDVPLPKVPKWLGVDRALAGLKGLEKIKKNYDLKSNSFFIADGGTVFSITKFNQDGEYSGGLLLPGFSLQLKSMEKNTKNLKYKERKKITSEKLPMSTLDSMIRGSMNSIIFNLNKIVEEHNTTIFLCGGDSHLIFNEESLKKSKIYLEPNLVLEGMISLCDL